MALYFNNINYEIKSKKILNNITGKVNLGDFVAIMGPSGSGKTTLLNILGRRIKDNLTGEFTHFDKIDVGFVLQDDLMFPNLTIRQTLEFTVKTRRPELSQHERNNEIDKLTSYLGLDNIIDMKIGDINKRGISGGEKRRVNICTELLSNPKILFLDEPTSGLDTPTAIKLLQMLKKLCDDGVTVIFSIHQPPAQTYYLFDKLLFLVDGCIIYQGKPNELKSYLKHNKIKFDKHLNPADYIMQIILEDKSDDFKNELIKKWDSEQDLEESSYFDKTKHNSKKKILHPIKQILLLAQRSFYQNFKVYLDPVDNIILLARCVFIGMLWFQHLPSYEYINESAGIVYSALLIISLFRPAYMALDTFTTEHTIIGRELDTGAYYLYSYYIAKTICEIPYLLFQPTVFIILFYFIIGFKLDVSAFIFAYSIIVANTFTSNAIGLLISVVSKNVDQASKIMDSLLIVSSFVGGFWARYIPIWLGWLQYLSPIAYGYQALLLNEFSDKQYTINNTTNNNNNNDTNTTIYNGNEFLDGFTIWFSYDNIWIYFIIIMGFNVFYRILAFIALKFSFSKRKISKCC